MCYNYFCQDEQKTRALCFSEAAFISQSDIVGKAPSMCWTNVLAVRLDNGGTHGGRFAMPKKNVKKNCKRCGKSFIGRDTRNYCSPRCKSLDGWDTRGRGRNFFEGTCEVCGKKFRANDYRPRRACSIQCGVILREKNGWKSPWEDEDIHPPGYKGGVIKKGQYLIEYVPDHPNADAKGYVMQHRLVMERMLGRYLKKREQVHHKNGIKTDNRPENLEIVTHAKPYGRVTCPHCGEDFYVH